MESVFRDIFKVIHVDFLSSGTTATLIYGFSLLEGMFLRIRLKEEAIFSAKVIHKKEIALSL
jgi:hypothetical protein